jgi:hypothetical protein
MKAVVKLDKITCSSMGVPNSLLNPNKFKFPGYKFVKLFDATEYYYKHKKDQKALNYKYILKYQDKTTGNSLIIYNTPRMRKIPAFYLLFYGNYFNPLEYDTVMGVLGEFQKQFGVDFNLSQVHLALDFVNPVRVGLFGQVLLAIKPGKKRLVRVYRGTHYFGQFPSIVTVYDKGRQLRGAGLLSRQRDVVRVELRAFVGQIPRWGLVRRVGDLGDTDFSPLVYPVQYSFLQPTRRLRERLRSAGFRWPRPVWRVRDDWVNRLGLQSSNLFFQYFEPHPEFDPLARSALRNFHWRTGSVGSSNP